MKTKLLALAVGLVPMLAYANWVEPYNSPNFMDMSRGYMQQSEESNRQLQQQIQQIQNQLQQQRNRQCSLDFNGNLYCP